MRYSARSVASTAATVLLCVVALGLVAARIVPPSPRGAHDGLLDDRIDSQLFYEMRSGGQRIGPQDAPVNLVVFATYSCHACAAFWPVLDSIRQRYPEHVAIEVRTFVPTLDRSNGAILVHLAAECAADEGRFLPFTRAAYADPTATRDMDGWLRLGRAAGLIDMERFVACTKSHRYLGRLKADARLGKLLGIPGTPTSFINGHPVVGALSFDQLDSMVGSILRSPLDY